MLPPGWSPQSLMQEDYIRSDAQILCGGGAAGTYKTESLLIDALDEIRKPSFHGILFRETFPELSRYIIPRAHAIYSQMGALYNSQDHSFSFPSASITLNAGAVMRFAYMGADKDVYPHQGAPYSWIGFDESTHQNEFRIRYMLSRLRTTDPTLFPRMRMATNPGGPGHALHSHVFLGGKCPHCETGGKISGKIYSDATWLSDKKPIGFTTQYLFGKWDPKGLLPDYGASLDTQGGATAKALKEGCWRAFEGQYFDIWEPNRLLKPMVVNRATIKDDWWWTFWTGTDYGFSGSIAFAVQAAVNPEGGPICIIDEYPHDIADARKQDCKKFAKNTYEALIKKPARYDQPPRVAGLYLSPDAWAERGDGHSLAALMNEYMEGHELVYTQASNDRAGGAMLLYTMLQTGQLVIANTCKNTMAAIESRIHDKKEPVKVEKVIGDPLDDVYDALRYCIYSYHEAERKPLNMRIEERLAKVLNGDTGNATRAAVEYTRIVHEESMEDEPATYSGNARRRFDQMRNRNRRF